MAANEASKRCRKIHPPKPREKSIHAKVKEIVEAARAVGNDAK